MAAKAEADDALAKAEKERLKRMEREARGRERNDGERSEKAFREGQVGAAY